MEETLISVINTLRERGYTEDFIKEAEFLKNPQNFEIDKIYRFDGMTDMEDEAIAYAISSKDRVRKGIIINAYGIYSDERVNKLIDKMAVKV